MYNGCSVYTPPDQNSGGTGTGFSDIVNTYSDLPLASSVPGEFYYVKFDQGTWWLPGSAGGNYYPAGTYLSTGVTWLTGISPYQATLATVNAGIVTDQFVSPYTFENASKWNNYQLLSGKNAASGYAGLSASYQINLSNQAGTVLNLLTTLSTTTRTWTFPDQDGTVAMLSDIPSLTGYVPYTGATANVNLGTFTLTTPQIIGGSGVTSKLTYTGSTNATPTSTASAHEWYVGNTGSTLAMTILHSGNAGLGTTYSQTVGSFSVSTSRQLKVTNASGTSRLTAEGTGFSVLDLYSSSNTADQRWLAMLNNSNTFQLKLLADNATDRQYLFMADLSNGNVGIGLTSASARLEIKSTTEQFRASYDASNRFTTTVGSTGITTFNAAGTGASFVFSKGISLPYVAKTANYTITSSDYTVDCTANSFTVTLPTAVGHNRIHNIKNSGSGTTITLATTSSQTIDGSATQSILSLECFTVQSNGSNWIVI